MKNRRTVLLSFLLIACLCIGIGYAVVTANVTISGNATSAAAPIDIRFTAASITGANAPSLQDDAAAKANHEAAIVGASKVGALGDITISLTAAGLTYANDTVTASFTITNYNEFAVDIAQPTISTLTSFEATVADWADSEDGTTVSNGTLTLPAGETETFTVTVKLLSSSADKLNESFTVTFAASAGTQATN